MNNISILWEENDSIEPNQKLENKLIFGQNVGINETKNVFVKNGCESIGNKRKWKKIGCNHTFNRRNRKCPICKHNIFIEKSISKHGDRYDYSNVEYIDNKTKIKIKCKIHGEFLQIPSDHTNSGCGCRKCGFEYTSKLFCKSKRKFIEDAIKIHFDKYDYSDVNYINERIKVKIKCIKCNTIFNQSPYKHLIGHGCPKCNLSIGELLISNYLKRIDVDYIQQMTYTNLIGVQGGNLKYDFYIPSKNLLIEYDGEQHFKRRLGGKWITSLEDFKRMKEHDNRKDKYALRNNIELIRIPYWKKNKISQIIDKVLL